MDLGSIRVTEVPHHEHITLIAIARRVPLLVNGDSIDVLDGGMLYDEHIVERNFNVSIRTKSATEILEVLLLRLAGIDDFVACGGNIRTPSLDHPTSDDECIVGEHLTEEVQILLIVGGSYWL